MDIGFYQIAEGVLINAGEIAFVKQFGTHEPYLEITLKSGEVRVVHISLADFYDKLHVKVIP